METQVTNVKNYRPIIQIIEAAPKPEQKERRCAYVRVSSDSAEQENSYDAQIKHYTDYFAEHDEYAFVGIFADEAQTGLKAENRDELNRMLLLCRMGKVDKIVTKSISRFSRNIRVTLETVRELKTLGVSVLFEKEGIDTEFATSEMLLTAYGVFAQEESLSISRNQKLGRRMRMRQGTLAQSNAPFGYYLSDKELHVNEDEAAVVRRIFREYLAGQGMDAIANDLTGEKVMHGASDRWDKTAVKDILGNERYMGDKLWQKKYTTDTLPLITTRNYGEREKYLVCDSHQPIVSRSDFEQVTQLIAQKHGRFYIRRAYSNHPLSGYLICSRCHTSFRRKLANNQAYWTCRTRDRLSPICTSREFLREADIEFAFINLYNKLRQGMGSLVIPMLHALEQLQVIRSKENPRTAELDRQLKSIAEQNHLLSSLRANGTLDSALCISQQNELSAKAKRLRQERSQQQRQDECDTLLLQSKVLASTLEDGPSYMEQFDATIFKLLIRSIEVGVQGMLTFILCNGVCLTEQVERRCRR